MRVTTVESMRSTNSSNARCGVHDTATCFSRRRERCEGGCTCVHFSASFLVGGRRLLGLLLGELDVALERRVPELVHPGAEYLHARGVGSVESAGCPPSRRTLRCCDTAGRLTGSSWAMSATERGLPRSCTAPRGGGLRRADGSIGPPRSSLFRVTTCGSAVSSGAGRRSTGDAGATQLR